MASVSGAEGVKGREEGVELKEEEGPDYSEAFDSEIYGGPAIVVMNQQRAPCSNKEDSFPSMLQSLRVPGIQASSTTWQLMNGQLPLPEAETESQIGSGSFPESEKGLHLQWLNT